jgi:hypothetical protein
MTARTRNGNGDCYCCGSGYDYSNIKQVNCNSAQIRDAMIRNLGVPEGGRIGTN